MSDRLAIHRPLAAGTHRWGEAPPSPFSSAARVSTDRSPAMLACARASFVGRIGSTERRPTRGRTNPKRSFERSTGEVRRKGEAGGSGVVP